MFRRLVLVGLFGLILSLNSPFSNAAIKAGDSCPTVGKTKKVGSQTLICKKQGKKSVWMKNKSSSNTAAGKSENPTPNPSPIQTQSPTPTVSPTPTPTSTPTPTPTQESIPQFLTMNDANNELALKVAWQSFNKRMLEATNPKSKIELRTGDKTDKSRANDYIKSLTRSVAFWDDIYSPSKPIVAALSYSDEYAWMENQWKQFGLNPKDMGGESGYKANGADCNQGSATLNNGTDPFFWGCLASRGSIDFIGVQKFAGHEYTHIVQSFLIEWKSGSYKRSALPFLFTEGSADFYGIASSSNNQEEFLKNWSESRVRGFFGGTKDKAEIKTWDTDKWVWALNENAKNNQIPESPGVQYYSGREVVARLIGLKGHEGFVNFMKTTESSQDWKKSFLEIYGLSWDEFTKKIAPELVVITKNLIP